MEKAIRQFVFLLVLITALPQVTNAGILSALGLKSLVPVMTFMQPTPPGLPSAPCRTYSVYVTHRHIAVPCNDVNYVVNHGGTQISANLDQSVDPSTSDYSYNSFHWKKLATGVITDASGQFTVRMRPSVAATTCASGYVLADAIMIVDDLGRKYVIDDTQGNAVVASGSGSWTTETRADDYNGQATFVTKATASGGNFYFDWTFDAANYFTDLDGDGIYDDCDIDDDNDGILDIDEITLGKIANPFTSLEQARANVFKAGRYYFNLSGNKFSTYVNEAGYVLVAVDYGDGAGALATSTKLGLTKATYGRGILNTTTLAALGTVSELRISTNSTSAGGVDVTTSNSTLISRLKANQSLHRGVADNAINENWSGINQAYLRADATSTTSIANDLSNNIIHPSGNGSALTWIPASNYQRVRWGSGEIANDKYMALWVRGNTSGVTQDSDNDGTPNQRDLDSDDDGCSDAFEAGATTDTTTDYQFTATPDANENGLNDNVENGTTGNINYTSTYAHYALNDAIKVCLDSDSDGVRNLIDIDDDNDGVPDLTECNEARVLDMGSFDGLTATVGTGVVGYASLPGTNTNVKLTLVSNGISGSITAKASGASFNDRDPSGDGSAIQIGGMSITNAQESYVQFEFEVPVYNLSFVIADIDGGNNSGPEVTKVEGSLNGSIYTPIASVSSSGPIPTQTGTEFSGSGASSSNAMLIEYAEPVDKLVIRVTGANASYVSLTQTLFNLNYTVCPDTDGDGTTNELDLDSDDDGCSDAYEAGATTDLSTDYQFAATPDANDNGLNDNVENGTTGNINYISTYEYYALSDAIKACLDSDGDSVPDLIDLDDDNDGVLDIVESGCGTAEMPFTSLSQARSVPYSGRYYFDLGSGVFQADVDASEGGGWVLVAQYVHQGGTNPALTVLGVGNDFPVTSTSALGIDESANTDKWGHAGNAALNQFSGDFEVRFYGETNAHSRKIHFKTPLGTEYLKTGTGSFAGLAASNVLLSGHTANLPTSAASYYSNQGDLALTNFPFYRAGTYHWGISGAGTRWEVDNPPSGSTYNTIHRVWVRSTVIEQCAGVDTDGDSTPNHLDLDSDNDGCSDAFEAGATTDTTTDYQFAATPDVNGNGLNDNVENGTTGNTNYTSTYAHYALNEDIKACLDSDGDNVPDLIDLDDDNDGVLDLTECNEAHILDMGSFDGLTATVGTRVVGYASLPGTSTNVKLTLVSNGNSGSITAKASGGTFNARDPSGDGSVIQIGSMNITNAQESYVQFEFEVPVYNLSFVYADIDGGNNSGPEVTKIEGSLNGDVFTPNASISSSGPIPTQSGTEFSGAGANSSNAMLIEYAEPVDKLVIRVTGANANYVTLAQSLFNLNYTVCPDTDGDGTTNELDLDSDDDGCSDAYEAGATTDLSTDYQFAATPDANDNGLNDDVENGTTGNINYISTYEYYALSDATKACLDSDGDSVLDLIDLDDDNDGVLDIVESGCGTAEMPFTSLSQARSVPYSGRYYFDLGSGVFQADVDASEGGGWVLVAQYVHQGGTNPALTVLGAGSDFPVMSTSALGIDESANTDKWGHAGNAALNQFSGDFEVRFYGEINAHSRKIHFKTPLGTSYLKTGTGSFSGINSSNTLLTGHTANLPVGATNFFVNEGDFALTSFPFYTAGNYHWGVRAMNRWEVDDYNNGSSNHTIHRVWVRSTVIEQCSGVDTDGDGTPNHLDLDSDDDGCSDAFEAGVTTDTTTDYQFAATPDVNGNGLNDDVEDGTSGNVVYAHTSTYAAYALNDDFKLCVDTDGDSVADIYDIDDDNDGTLDNAECYDSPTVLDWSENAWAPGAMSNTYTVLGNTFDFTITDPSGAMLGAPPAPYDLPLSGPNYQGGFDNIDDQLVIAADINTLGTSNIITTAIDMGVSGIGLDNVSFKLFDIDGNTATNKVYKEQYTIRGYLNGVEVAPALIGNSGYQIISGNVINGLIEAPTTGASSGNGTVGVYFTQAIDRVEIDFGIAPGGDINGSRPGFGIYDIVFFSDCDKDGDGTPNHLDLDSDGDGCSDAYEAGATTDLSTDYQFAATPDANGNGLNDNVENGNSDQINYTSTYGNFALYAALKACEDYDGDSVFNGIDLDDDNDGVLDTDEGSDCILTYSFSGTLDGSRDRGAANNDQNRDFVFGDNYAFNLDFDCEIGIEISTTFGDAIGGRTGVVTVDGTAKSFHTGINEFKAVTHVPSISDGYSVQVSGADVSMTQMTVTDAFGNVLVQFDFGTSGSPVASGYIGINETLTSGTVTVSPMTVDTDGDGAFNLLDLDSDGDGCSDAYEGGSTEDLSTDFQYPATPDVNSNGLNDTVEDGTTGNINYTLTYDEYALNDELQLCDCQFLWLKADAGTLNGASAATDGQAVNTWQDQTAWRTNNATDVNLASPTFRNNSSDYINYNSVVEFDGVNDGLDFGGDYIFAERSGMTWLTVVMPDVTAATKDAQFIYDFGVITGAGYGFTYSSSNSRSYTPTAHGGAYVNTAHGRSNQVTLTRMFVEYGGLQTITYNASGTPESSLSNSLSTLSAAEIGENPVHTSGAGPFTIGRQSKSAALTSNDGRFFQGKIAEIIGFCNPLTPSQLSRFESYLAVKWGITKDNSDGGEYGDYVDHDGTVVWDASEYAAHHYNVAGIGRDDAISLNQKQSKSVNADAILSIGLDANTDGLESSNADNTSTFSSDKSYMLWGHDNEPFGDRHIKEFDPLQVNSRLNREWRATKTGDIGTVTLEFDVTSLPGPTGVGTNDESQIVLLLDADGDFRAGATVVTQSYIVASDGIVKFSANIPDGAYFTLASSEEEALPITLVDFEVRQTEDGAVELYWTTASEVNNSHFVIERSTNGYGFSEIGFKTGAVNSTELVEYQYFDLQPPAGKAYYRLKQVDINGAYEYSPVRTINIKGEGLFNVVVYPNPVHSGQDLLLEFNGSRIEGRAELEVFGVNSTSVYKSTFEFNEGDNKNVVVPTNGFSQGLYIVAVSWNNGSKRIFKRVVVH
ncbi:RHS repeat domain-containing protein [Roseivirga pacifica]